MDFGQGLFDFDKSSYDFTHARVSKHSNTGIYCGLPIWSETNWVNKLYPPETKKIDFLKVYSQRLKCVEVSSTFYAPVGKETFIKWKEIVPRDFKFLPKWPKSITHDKRLQHCQNEIKLFLKNILYLDQNLGATILQLPPTFSIDYKKDLFYFLKLLPSNFPLTIEFRHSSWLKNNRVYEALENYLVENNIGMAISDTPGNREVFHLSFTGAQNIVRYLSDQQYKNDKKRLKLWKESKVISDPQSEVFMIFHNPDNSYSTELIGYFDSELASKINEKNKSEQLKLL